jgi:hypothetical protein
MHLSGLFRLQLLVLFSSNFLLFCRVSSCLLLRGILSFVEFYPYLLFSSSVILTFVESLAISSDSIFSFVECHLVFRLISFSLPPKPIPPLTVVQIYCESPVGHRAGIPPSSTASQLQEPPRVSISIFMCNPSDCS